MDTDAQDEEVGREVVENEEVAEREAAEDQDFFAADKEEEAEIAKEATDAEAAEVASGEKKPTSEQMEDEAEGRSVEEMKAIVAYSVEERLNTAAVHVAAVVLTSHLTDCSLHELIQGG